LTPVRIVILAVLFYFLYKLIFPSRRAKQPQPDPSGSQTNSPEMLREDPVCHTYIPEGQAEILDHNGKKYYFCSEECKKTFSKENEL